LKLKDTRSWRENKLYCSCYVLRNRKKRKIAYKNKRRRRAITPAAIPPVTGTVTIHATIIFRNKDQSTLCLERTRPIATTLPTLQCVVLIGIDKFDATSTVNAVEISMTKPLKMRMYFSKIKDKLYLDGVIFVKSSPIVRITRRPQTQRPTDIPSPPKKSTQSGVADRAATVPST
jgi:hypothetical protein